MEMTGSARKVTERSWHPPSAAAGGTAPRSRLAQGEARGASGHLGPPCVTGHVLAASCPCEVEPAHPIGPSLTPPQSAFQVSAPAPRWLGAHPAPEHPSPEHPSPEHPAPFVSAALALVLLSHCWWGCLPSGTTSEHTHPFTPRLAVLSSSLQPKETLQAGDELAPGPAKPSSTSLHHDSPQPQQRLSLAPR